ncbi:MAG: flippase [Candidatus Dormibacteraeota bacterium]|nr:flippase [Candidatus Dormibacteraeota bacterium]
MQDVPAGGAAHTPAGHAAGMGSRALRNTTLILATRVVSRLLTLVTVPLIVAHLRPAGFGRFQLVVGLAGIITVVLDLGFNTLFQREAARQPSELSRFLSNLVSARILFAVPALAVFAAGLWVFGLRDFIVPGFVMMLLASYATLLRASLYAVQRLGFEAAGIVLETLVLVALVVVGVRTGQGIAFFLWAYAGSYSFSCVYFLVVITLRGVARLRWRLEWGLIRHFFWTGLPFALTFVISVIYFRIDQPILVAIRGYTENGWYTAAYKPFEALLFVPISMLNVVFPVLAVYHHDASGRVAWAVARFYKALLMLGWPATVGMFLLTDAFRVIYVFPEAAAALRILALGVVFMFVSNAFIGALNSIDRQVLFTWIAALSMVVNIGLNLILIPLYGYLGAAAATVLTEIVLFAAGWVLVARHLGPVPVHRLSWRVILAGLVMGAALWPVQHVTGPAALAVVGGGALVYGLALLILGAVDREERTLLLATLKR